MKNWKQILAGLSTAALLLTNVGVSTPLSVYADEVSFDSKTTIETEDKSVSVTATLPKGATNAAVTAESASVTVEGQDVLAAYDITIKYTDAEDTEQTYQPAENETASVTIKAEALGDEETVNVYHFKSNDDTSPEQIGTNVEVKDGSVTFTTSSFSPFAVTKPEEEQEVTLPDIKSASIEDKIAHDGTFVATFKDGDGKDITSDVLQAAKDGNLTISWTSDGGDIADEAATDQANVLTVVKDSCAQKTYTVKVQKPGDDTVLASANLKANYYDEIVNGGFDTTTGTPSVGTSWKIYGDSSQSGNVVKGWHTTASDHSMEIGAYAASNSAHGVYNDKYDSSVGNQYAELNANEASTLYQDVLTEGGLSLNWSMLHRARTNTSPATDKMYAVIMSTEDAEKAMAGIDTKNHAVTNTILTMIRDVAHDGAEHEYTLVAGEHAGEKVTLTVWDISTTSYRNPYKATGTMNGTDYTSESSGWIKYSGSYTVPEGQYLTRFFFASNAAVTSAEGNLLDEVQFDQKVDYTIQYYLWDADKKAYVLQNDYTESGRVKPNAKVTADKTTSFLSAHEGAELVGTAKGETEQGSNATINKNSKVTYFSASSTMHYLSLYYKVPDENETNISGKITWVGDKDETRPKSVTVKVYNGDEVVDTITVTVNDEGDWTYTSDDLPKKDGNDKEIDYTIKVEPVDGYSVDVDGTDVTCTYVGKTNVGGKITWVDHDDEDKIRPDDVTVTIYDKDGNVVGTAKVTEGENDEWTYSVDNLPKYDKDGHEIEYTIKVSTVDGYEAEVDGTDATMTHEPETTVSGEITWFDNNDKYGIRPETVEIQLLDKDGKPVTDSEGNPITTTAKIDENGNYTYSFDELPKYDEDGNEIVYNVKPIVPGYEIETESNGKGGFDITCTLNKDNDDYKNYFPAEDPYMWILVDPPVEKVIEGDEPSSDTTFTFELVPYSVDLTDGTEMLVKEMPLPTSLTGEANHTVVTIKGEGQDEFGNFRFNHPGTYVYHVTERNDGVERYTYDNATYVVTFAVEYDKKDGWTCKRTIQRNGKGEDTGICTFTNTYKAPASNNNNDNDDNDSKSSGKHDGGKYAKVDFYLVDDANTQPLSSGVFALYSSAGELIGTYTTDAAGHIQFPNLKGGSYYLVQLSAPNGYELNGTRVNFTVDGTPLALMLTDKAAGAATSAADTAATVAPSDAAAADAATAGPDTENGAAVGGATGDESNMVLYGAATGAAAILLAVWFVMNRRRANG